MLNYFWLFGGEASKLAGFSSRHPLNVVLSKRHRFVDLNFVDFKT